MKEWKYRCVSPRLSGNEGVQMLRSMNTMYIHIDIYTLDKMKATPFQTAQGLQLLQTGKIVELVKGILYQVPSSKAIGSPYFVYYGTPRACNCEGYYWQGQKGIKHPICSHIKAVGFFRGNQQ